MYTTDFREKTGAGLRVSWARAGRCRRINPPFLSFVWTQGQLQQRSWCLYWGTKPVASAWILGDFAPLAAWCLSYQETPPCPASTSSLLHQTPRGTLTCLYWDSFVHLPCTLQVEPPENTWTHARFGGQGIIYFIYLWKCTHTRTAVCWGTRDGFLTLLYYLRS